MELSDTFKMIVLSTRSSAVIIDDWKVTDVTCRKSTAQTVVAYPPQGGAAHQGIRPHIPPRADEPVLTDDTQGQGEPYFGTHYIEVGGGQPSGGIRAEAIAPPGQSCAWGISIPYNDSYQKGRWVQLRDGKGKPSGRQSGQQPSRGPLRGEPGRTVPYPVFIVSVHLPNGRPREVAGFEDPDFRVVPTTPGGSAISIPNDRLNTDTVFLDWL